MIHPFAELSSQCNILFRDEGWGSKQLSPFDRTATTSAAAFAASFYDRLLINDHNVAACAIRMSAVAGARS